MKWLNLVIGGTVGTVARYGAAGFVYKLFGSSFPYGTLVVNLTGCFLVGFLAALSEEKFLLGPEARMLWMVGFCGAYTTFSTFMLETSHLMRDGEMMRAFWNVTASVVVGFLALRAGVYLGKVI
ncbi:MAG: fluoride efflux transporter CrcB [Candidatus Omnitrophota bacterium]|jgi:CrcB protein